MKHYKLSILAITIGTVFMVPTQAALVSGFEGASVFGDTDSTAGSTTCPLCDSTVSFAVWKNESGNWLNDSFFSGAGTATALAPFSSSVDTTANYVYLYQVNNTDPLAPPEQELENFNISFGPVGTAVPFTSGGYFDGTVFSGLSSALVPLDVPNNHTPSLLTSVGNLVAGVGVNPDGLSQHVITSNAVQNSALPAEGMLYSWNVGNEIQPGAASSVVFLTSNKAPVYQWAETESPGGSGTAGDVPSVPVPATLPLLALGLIGIRRFRGKK